MEWGGCLTVPKRAHRRAHMAKKRYNDVVRVHMAWKGAELASIQEVRDLVSLNDEASTIRYLVTRGIEAMTPQLANRRMIRKLESQYTPQQMMPFIEQLAKEGNG